MPATNPLLFLANRRGAVAWPAMVTALVGPLLALSAPACRATNQATGDALGPMDVAAEPSADASLVDAESATDTVAFEVAARRQPEATTGETDDSDLGDAAEAGRNANGTVSAGPDSVLPDGTLDTTAETTAETTTTDLPDSADVVDATAVPLDVGEDALPAKDSQAVPDATADAMPAGSPCTPTACDDGQPCTADLCDPASGACVHLASPGPCAAGAGVCQLGQCCLPKCTAGPCGADGCGGQCPCPSAQVCHAGACIADPEWSDWPAPPDGPTAYTATDDVVVDNATKLTWQRAQMPSTLTWTNALAACEALVLGGHSDWRLPTATELFSIVDLTRLAPAIEPGAFPATTSAPFWSASPHAKAANVAWAVDFANGRIDFGPYATWQARRVRCVRSPIKPPGGKQ